MSRSNRQGASDMQECWTLRMLRRLREHTELVGEIYEDLRPVGRGFVKVAALPFGCFAGLGVLEQVVSLLR